MTVATPARPAAKVTVADVVKGDRVPLNGGWQQVADVKQRFIGGPIRLVFDGPGRDLVMSPAAQILVRHAATDAPAEQAAPEPETHPLPQPGDLVIARFWSGQITYGGPYDGGLPGGHALSIGVKTELFADVEDVAPADAPAVDAKDPRIVVEKLNAREHGVYGTKPQAWRATLPNGRTLWKDTKRDATAQAQVALAVADWHAARAAALS